MHITKTIFCLPLVLAACTVGPDVPGDTEVVTTFEDAVATSWGEPGTNIEGILSVPETAQSVADFTWSQTDPETLYVAVDGGSREHAISLDGIVASDLELVDWNYLAYVATNATAEAPYHECEEGQDHRVMILWWPSGYEAEHICIGG